METNVTTKRRPISLAWRVTALVGITTTLVFLTFNWIIVRSLEHHFAEQDAGELQAVANAVSKTLEVHQDEATTDAMMQRLSAIVVGRHGMSYSVWNASGQLLYKSVGPDLSPVLKNSKIGTRIEDDQLLIWNVDGKSYRGGALQIPDENVEVEPRVVAVAMDIDFHLDFLDMFKRILWWATLIVALIALVVAWLAVQWGHRPIRKVSGDIRAIRSSQLDVRLDPADVPIELTELALSFNAMLGRIEDGFAKLANFSADIAHELRTPVTNLSTQTQVALGQVRTVDEYREVLYSNLEEFDRMSLMIGDMLFLAQTENDPRNLRLAKTDIGMLVQGLFDYFGVLAEDADITLSKVGKAKPIYADRDMMLRALSNLLSNAIRYSASGSSVLVRLHQDEKLTIISVENPGEQIADDDLPKLFDRFFRTDPSRQRKSGAGLGLAIVKSIVEAHDGTVQATSRDGWNKFTVSLPTNAVVGDDTVIVCK
ncbi:Cu(+)/Ag(+) sensor histidine kinase [Oxalicibacterium faecigallinarum]|uniref:Sensor protein n=1 Tax=Oxalicibacterium faecigallinarum TaxID=573741 RepID=A0A8J3AM20_9BURK|nr:Cu(+)/Ag(+) sensor histidine kinase [Oxalicibacterium faecigallinarum]GGI16963.1 two-component sensor histidine kinase [Oxalicibacterium faecigallinarum]